MAWKSNSWDDSANTGKKWDNKKTDSWQESGWSTSEAASASASSTAAPAVTAQLRPGLYQNKTAFQVIFEQNGSTVTAKCPKGEWTDSGSVTGNTLTIFKGKQATIHQDGSIDFGGGDIYVSQEGLPGAASAGAASASAAVAEPPDPWESAAAASPNWRPDRGAPAATAGASTAAADASAANAWAVPSGAEQANPWEGYGAGSGPAPTSWNSGAGAAQASNCWGATNAAGGWGENAPDAAQDEERKRQRRLRDFQSYQDWYVKENKLPGKLPEEMDLDDERLFKKNDGREGIDFGLYDSVPCNITGPRSENMPELTTFEKLFVEFQEQIPAELKGNIRRCGFQRPTPVQKYAIPAALSGRDVMCCAQTGSGKTVAFLIPVLASTMKYGKAIGGLQQPFKGPCKPDTLIISPTRELCVQIYEDALRFTHRTPHRCVRVYGQDSVKHQIEQLALGADLVVSTPGRLWDFVSSGVIDVTEVHCLVLDEADRMLEMQKQDDQEYIKKVVEDHGMPQKEHRQTMMFSATFPDEIQKMAEAYLHEHLFVAIGIIGGAVTTVSQTFKQVAPEDKFQTLIDDLHEFLDTPGNEDAKALVFVNSRATAKGLDEQLYDQHHISSCAFHGDLSQPEREANLIKFRRGEVRVVVATDLASRGLDISHVGLVVNYDLPKEKSVYVQRIGRTGRIGHRGAALSYVSVGKDGEWKDEAQILQELPVIITDAGGQVPDWLASKAAELKEGKWTDTSRSNKWEGRTDARNWDSWTPQPQEPQAGGWTPQEQPQASAPAPAAQGGGGWGSWEERQAAAGQATEGQSGHPSPAAQAADPWN